jgi:hypothetical protein
MEPPYAHFGRPGHDPVGPVDIGDDEYLMIHILRQYDGPGLWRAIWGQKKVLGDFTGTREQAIAWARERCDTILIYSPALDDMVELGPDDH